MEREERAMFEPPFVTLEQPVLVVIVRAERGVVVEEVEALVDECGAAAVAVVEGVELLG